MKKLMTFVLCFFVAATTFSQSVTEYMKHRAISNLEYLSNNPIILKRVKVNDHGIEVAGNHGHTEFRMTWKEVPKFVDLIENLDYYSTIDLYRDKKTNHFVNVPTAQVHQFYVNYPTDIKDLRIAIDPGHFGGDLEEARLENRIVKIKGSDLHQENDVKFFEADLTYTTALILKKKLEARGAQVLITRPYGAGAKGTSFSQWLRKDFNKDVQESLSRGDVEKSYYDSLRKCYTDTVKLSNRYHLFQYFKFLDFRARARRINDFYPNVTFVIHYNASENNRPYGPDRFIHPVESNYSMVFVPGSFEHDELSKPDQKVDFLRLLLSPDLDNSARLANILVQKHKQILGVDPIPFDSLRRMKNVIIPTAFNGVFSRNLYLTRAVRGAIVYGESVYQDNRLEALKLSQRDYTVIDTDGTVYRTSKRCAQVAEAYDETIMEYLLQNKKKQEEYTASISRN